MSPPVPGDRHNPPADDICVPSGAEDAHILRLAGAPWTGIGWSLALPCEVTSSSPPCSCRLKVGHGGPHEAEADGEVVRWD